MDTELSRKRSLNSDSHGLTKSIRTQSISENRYYSRPKYILYVFNKIDCIFYSSSSSSSPSPPSSSSSISLTSISFQDQSRLWTAAFNL